EIADQLAVAFDSGCLPRMQRRVLTRNKAEGIGGASEAQQRFNISLDIEEVDFFALVCPAFRQTLATDEAGNHALLLQSIKLTDKTQATLEQADTGLLAIEVVLQCLDQTWPER